MEIPLSGRHYSDQARPRVRRPVLRQKAWSERPDRVKTRLVAADLEAIGQADHGFRRAED